MRKTLWLRLITCYMAAVVLVFVLVNTYGRSLLEQRIIEESKSKLAEEADFIVSEYLSIFGDSTKTTDELMMQLNSISKFLGIRTWIVNDIGRIIIDSSDKPSARDRNVSDLYPGLLNTGFTANVFVAEVFTEPMLALTRPISYNYDVNGYIILFTSYKAIQNSTDVYLEVINTCFLIFLSILLLIFLYIYLITLVPLRRLTKAAREYSQGNYNYALVLKGLNDYKELGAAISYMSKELSKLDDYQKKFVANISHDFRSPLTSIKGFAEAIKDGTIPRQQQDKYLDIILFETERLNKLTSNLLELNRFETKAALLDITSFDINSVIKKTAASFEGSCREKKISINLLFSSKELYVNADMDKIQQVLYNLIDNAIKFSHNNSNIKISSEEKGEKVFISVKDYGIGIPRDSLNRIWERFFKTDASRGKDKRGTGLGLSITKEIIQAHNENITVVSTEGVGSEFTFSLPKAEL
ncbi:MAG: GHKL domain-containing protein [Clostridiales bacterium]|nr:GHKL domain-containing protein [Clostridiales bacterium]